MFARGCARLVIDVLELGHETRVLCTLDDAEPTVVSFCDDVIGLAGARAQGVTTSERVDDDVLKTMLDVVLQLHDRSHSLPLTLMLHTGALRADNGSAGHGSRVS